MSQDPNYRVVAVCGAAVMAASLAPFAGGTLSTVFAAVALGAVPLALCSNLLSPTPSTTPTKAPESRN